jgi:hypothetical protein
MTPIKFALSAVLSIPGILFWVHLGLWSWGWIDQGRAENWWPVMLQYGLFFFSCLGFGATLVVAGGYKIASRKSGHLWIPAILNVSPPAIFYLSVLTAYLSRIGK